MVVSKLNRKFATKTIIMKSYGRKIIDYILRDGRNALQYVMSLSEKYRQIATEAIFECLRLGYPLNNMEITGKARELQRKRNAPLSIQLGGVEIIKKKIKRTSSSFSCSAFMASKA